MSKFGVNVPRGIVASTPQEVEVAAKELAPDGEVCDNLTISFLDQKIVFAPVTVGCCEKSSSCWRERPWHF